MPDRWGRADAGLARAQASEACPAFFDWAQQPGNPALVLTRAAHLRQASTAKNGACCPLVTTSSPARQRCSTWRAQAACCAGQCSCGSRTVALIQAATLAITHRPSGWLLPAARSRYAHTVERLLEVPPVRSLMVRLPAAVEAWRERFRLKAAPFRTVRQGPGSECACRGLAAPKVQTAHEPDAAGCRSASCAPAGPAGTWPWPPSLATAWPAASRKPTKSGTARWCWATGGQRSASSFTSGRGAGRPLPGWRARLSARC